MTKITLWWLCEISGTHCVTHLINRTIYLSLENHTSTHDLNHFIPVRVTRCWSHWTRANVSSALQTCWLDFLSTSAGEKEPVLGGPSAKLHRWFDCKVVSRCDMESPRVSCVLCHSFIFHLNQFYLSKAHNYCHYHRHQDVEQLCAESVQGGAGNV